MMLQENVFKSLLATMPEPIDEEARLEQVLKNEDEKSKEEASRAYYICKRIMKARTGVEIADIPLADILLCFKWQSIFSSMFESKKACDYIYEFKKNLSKLRTARAVRVL